MSTQNALVVRSNRFDRSRNLATRQTPPSMMVMQQLVGALTKMNEKIDALAVRQMQPPDAGYSRPIQVDVRPIDRQSFGCCSASNCLM
jgi:hypothetical protein